MQLPTIEQFVRNGKAAIGDIVFLHIGDRGEIVEIRHIPEKGEADCYPISVKFSDGPNPISFTCEGWMCWEPNHNAIAYIEKEGVVVAEAASDSSYCF